MSTLKRRLNRLEDQTGQGKRIPILLRRIVKSPDEAASYVMATTPAGTIWREEGERESAFLVRVYRQAGLARGLRGMSDAELEVFLAAYKSEISLAHSSGVDVSEGMLEDTLSDISAQAGEVQ